MLVVMEQNANETAIQRVKDRIVELGYRPHIVPGRDRLTISVIGNKGNEDRIYLESLRGVLEVIPISKPYKLASRETHEENTIIQVENVKFGNGNVVMIAGPCAVESEEQTIRIAVEMEKRGTQMLRGGAYKPRTSPYSFQGLGEEGLVILAKARDKTGLPFVTEVVDTETVSVVFV